MKLILIFLMAFEVGYIRSLSFFVPFDSLKWGQVSQSTELNFWAARWNFFWRAWCHGMAISYFRNSIWQFIFMHSSKCQMIEKGIYLHRNREWIRRRWESWAKLQSLTHVSTSDLCPHICLRPFQSAITIHPCYTRIYSISILSLKIIRVEWRDKTTSCAPLCVCVCANISHLKEF